MSETPCTDARCPHVRGAPYFNYRLHYFTSSERAAWGEILRRKWDDGVLRQLGLAPPPILDFSQLGEACDAWVMLDGKEWTPEEQAILAQRNPEPERRTCAICKQAIVDGRCRCIIG